MANSSKKYSTGMGTFVYPHLVKPDTKFDPKGVYKMSIECDAGDPVAIELRNAIDENNSGSKCPYDVDTEAGTITFRAKCSAEYPPRLFDASRKIIERNPHLSIYGGSSGRAFVRPVPYSQNGGGVMLRLLAVQIVDLVSGGGGCPFDEVEGGYEFDGADAGCDIPDDGADGEPDMSKCNF